MRSKKTAFTLVELLIVIVIIGILATIAVPQYNKMIWKAHWTQAIVVLDALRKNELLYYAEHSVFVDGIPGAGGDYAADASEMNSWLKQEGMDIEIDDEAFRYFNYDVYAEASGALKHHAMAIRKDGPSPDPDYALGRYGIAINFLTGEIEYGSATYYP